MKKTLNKIITACFISAIIFTAIPLNIVSAKTLENDTTALTEVQDATVNLYCNLRFGNKRIITSGTGVFIDDRGIILTNAHVAQYFLLAKESRTIRGRCSVRTGSPAKDTYSAEILYINPIWLKENADTISNGTQKGTGENDFALLYVDGKSRGKVSLPKTFPSIEINYLENYFEGNIVAIAGYPTENISRNKLKNKLKFDSNISVIDAIRGFGTKTKDYLDMKGSKITQQGISGGPILNKDGQLIALNSAKSLSEKNSTLRSITISYINRTLLTQNLTTLQSMMSGNLNDTAKLNRNLISEDTIDSLVKGFLSIGKK